MPMIINRPASGMPNWLSVEAITTSEARGDPGNTFRGDHQGRKHRKLGRERHFDVIGLRDEDACKRAVQS